MDFSLEQVNRKRPVAGARQDVLPCGQENKLNKICRIADIALVDVCLNGDTW